jgi:hypothetical protein
MQVGLVILYHLIVVYLAYLIRLLIIEKSVYYLFTNINSVYKHEKQIVA